MLTYVAGDLFASPAQVLVNTVNTVGVMGKGIAKEFKARYPEMYAEYRAECESGAFGIGNLILYRTSGKWILNFPTKRHWRGKSRLEDIEIGLKKFVERYQELGIDSIAFPQLGCGNGQLDWESEVRPLMERHLADLPINVFIHVRIPDAEQAEHTPVATEMEQRESDPMSPPFPEVWDALVDLVSHRPETSWSVVEDVASAFALRWIPDGTIVDASQVFDLWHQIRTFGYVSIADLAFDQQIAGAFFDLLEELPGFRPTRFLIINSTEPNLVCPTGHHLKDSVRGLSYNSSTVQSSANTDCILETDRGAGTWSESPTTKQLQLSLTA